MNTKAIILVAGQGTRLRPYTDDRPKCMVELAGRPLLHYQLDAIRSVGIEQILLVGGYRADKLAAEGVEIIVNPRYERTNMVSTLFCAESWMEGGEDILIAYGDIVYEPRVLQGLLSIDAKLAISVDRQWQRLWESRMEDPLSDAETLKLADGNRVIELGKKPQSLDEIQGQYMGLIKVRGDFVDGMRRFWHQMDRRAIYDSKDFDNMYMTSFLQHLIDDHHEVRAAFTDNGWIEVDTAHDLEHYEKLHRNGTLDQLLRLMW